MKLRLRSVVGLAVLAAPVAGPVPDTGDVMRVIVRGGPGGADDVVRAVEGVGGEVVRELAAVDGVVAEVAVSRLAALRVSPGVVAATEDGTVEFLDDDDDDDDDEASTTTGPTTPPPRTSRATCPPST